MKNPINDYREKRDDEWWERHRREHRWDALADYNSRVSKGIVHTPEYVERMRQEQDAFDAEQGHGNVSGFPLTLGPGESVTFKVPLR